MLGMFEPETAAQLLFSSEMQPETHRGVFIGATIA